MSAYSVSHGDKERDSIDGLDDVLKEEAHARARAALEGGDYRPPAEDNPWVQTQSPPTDIGSSKVSSSNPPPILLQSLQSLQSQTKCQK